MNINTELLGKTLNYVRGITKVIARCAQFCFILFEGRNKGCASKIFHVVASVSSNY